MWKKIERTSADGGRLAGLDETFDLIRRYVLQETVGPLKGLLRSLAVSLAGALGIAVGTVFLLIGCLRLFQGETGAAFSGNWSFLPYVFTGILGCLAIMAFVVSGMRRPAGSARRDQD